MPAYKDSKKGTWYCKFRYKDWQGNRKETTKRGFATKREAKEYEQEFIRKAQGTADMTLRSLYEIYLEDKRQNMAFYLCLFLLILWSKKEAVAYYCHGYL